MSKCLRGIVHSLVLGYALYVIVTEQKTPPPEWGLYDKPTQEICDLLIDTDKELVKCYAEKGSGQGEKIMTMFRKYNDNLAILVKRMMREKVHNETLVTKAEAQPLIDHGGPEFINFYVERPILETDFGLNNISSRVIISQRQNTIDMWQDFFALTSKIPDDEDEDDDDV